MFKIVGHSRKETDPPIVFVSGLSPLGGLVSAHSEELDADLRKFPIPKPSVCR